MKMKIILIIITWVFAIGSRVDGTECPIGFQKAKDDTCWRLKRGEIFSNKYYRCNGNAVPLEFNHTLVDDPYIWSDYVRAYNMGPFIKWSLGTEGMGELFLGVNWTQNSWQKCVAVNSLGPPRDRYVVRDCDEMLSRLCVVPAYGDSYPIAWDCPEGYLSFSTPERACIIAPKVSKTNRRVAARATLAQARRICETNSGHLLHRGYMYANHPELLSETRATLEVPLGISREGNEFYWTDLEELVSRDEWNFYPDEDFNITKSNVSLYEEMWSLRSASHIYNQIMCEYFVEPREPSIKLFQLGSSLILETKNIEDDDHVWCFTDSITYHPHRVEMDDDGNLFYILNANRNGYYWCLVVNTIAYPPVTSEQVLYFNEVEGYHQYSIMIQYKILPELPLNESLIEFIESEINEYLTKQLNELTYTWTTDITSTGSTTGLTDFTTQTPPITVIKTTEPNPTTNSYFFTTSNPTSESLPFFEKILAAPKPLLLSNSTIKRILVNGDILLSSLLAVESRDIVDFILWKNMPVELNNFTIQYVRSSSECNEQELFNVTNEITNPMTWTKQIGRVKINDTIDLGCESFLCTGDFNMGAYWKWLQENEPCGNTEPTTPIGTTPDGGSTTHPPTTTMKPDDQVNELAGQLQQIANSTTINSTQLETVSSQINSVLNFGQDVEIPKTILEDLDKIVNKVELSKNETQLKIVQPNFAIVVAERSGSVPIVGIRVDRVVNGFENNSIDIFNADETDQIMSNASGSDLIVNVGSMIGSNAQSRLSFVVFKNDNAFSVNISNNQQRVNSRVLSISIGNETIFEKDQYIDMHMRPIEGLIEKNETKFCAFWDFKLGANGNWSTEGCQLLKNTVIEGFDTCRCSHLTHFAQIIRNTGDIGMIHDLILSIISYTGCTLSLIGLFIIGLTGVLFKSWRSEFSNKIWMHLSASVTLLMLTFLVISAVTFDSENKALCVFFGASLHYSLLASFCWMFISALLSYKRLVTVFSKNSSHRLLKSCIFGWIIPLIPIIILFAVMDDPYPEQWEIGESQKKFCYPNGVSFWVSIFLPVTLIVMANTILFCIIIYSVFLSTNIQRHGDTKQLYRSLTVSFLLFFLFGLTWMFALFMEHIVLLYLFCITATMQGFILFTFFILANKKTRELWCVCLGVKDKKSTLVTSSVSTTKRSVSTEKSVPLKNITKPRSMLGNTNNFDARFS